MTNTEATERKKRRQLINGIMYEYEDLPYWDPGKKRGSHKRVYTGHYDKDGNFIQSKNYRARISNSEIETAGTNLNPKVSIPSKTFQHGATYLLEKIADRTGVLNDLKVCFPETYRMILSLVFFLIIESGKALYLARHFTESHSHPYGDLITSPNISKLLSSINEDSKLKFFKLQANRRLENEYLAYDLSSISSYSEQIKEVKHGYNKDGSCLPQVNLALVIGENSLLPVYYRVLPGNISDVKTVKKLIIDSKFLSIENLKFVMDRGFYDLENIKKLLANNISFVVGGRKNVSFIELSMNEAIAAGNDHRNFIENFNLYGYTFEKSVPVKLKIKNNSMVAKNFKLHIHIICDEEKATLEKINFNKNLHDAVDAVSKNSASVQQKKLFDQYCYTKYNNTEKTYEIEYNNEKIYSKTCPMGYFCLISDCYSDLNDIVKIYRHKDAVEKAFHSFKSVLSKKRTTQVHSIQRFEGLTFLRFVSLILTSSIHQVMSKNNLFKKYTMHEMLSDLDIIYKYVYQGIDIHYSEITKKQYALYKNFGINPPDL
jgi:transposase